MAPLAMDGQRTRVVAYSTHLKPKSRQVFETPNIRIDLARQLPCSLLRGPLHARELPSRRRSWSSSASRHAGGAPFRADMVFRDLSAVPSSHCSHRTSPASRRTRSAGWSHMRRTYNRKPGRWNRKGPAAIQTEGSVDWLGALLGQDRPAQVPGTLSTCCEYTQAQMQWRREWLGIQELAMDLKRSAEHGNQVLGKSRSILAAL